MAATLRPSTTPNRQSACTGPPATRPGRRSPSTPSAGATPCSATTNKPSPPAHKPPPRPQTLGDRHGQPASWDSLGYAHHHLGHHTQAITCYHHAVELSRDFGDRYGEADTLTHLGDTHQAAGDLEPARQCYQQAPQLLTDLDHTDAQHLRTKLHQLNRPATDPTP